MPISEVVTDQAAGLRQMGQRAPTRVVCIASGKGGVGKSHVTVNLALALAREQKRVMVLDADLGLANIDVILGLHPTHNLYHVINGQCDLKDVILTGPEGIRVIPASSGIEKMASLGNAEHAGLISAFSTLGDDLDILLIDSAAGISDSVMTFSRAAHDVIVVLCDELTALADAYALIKLLNRRYQIERFHIVANRIPRKQDGRALFEKLMKVTDRFLDVNLRYLGEVPEDPHLVKALKQQRAVMDAFPNSPSCLAFRRLAAHMERWPLPSSASGYLQFFLEQVISTASQEKALVQ